MKKFKNLPDVFEGKLISRNFGSIRHLKGSKMIDDKDKLIGEQQQNEFTICKRDPKDVVIITEKIDGMNAGVIKKNGLLYPINRKGYDTRKMGEQHKELEFLGYVWATWVDNHYHLYDSLVQEGERLVFENVILQHTLRYNFGKGDPVFLLAKYDANNDKVPYNELTDIAMKNGIAVPPLLNIGSAISPEIIINQYPNGIAGSKDGIEGIVYSYEINGVHQGCAKYVSNSIMGTIDILPSKFNNFKQKIFE